jgi:hypothetical protein
MNQDDKQQLTLLNMINDVVEFIKKNREVEAHVYDRLEEAFLSLGLSEKNQINELLDILKTDRSKLDEFTLIFNKWLDVNIIALSNRVKTSKSY